MRDFLRQTGPLVIALTTTYALAAQSQPPTPSPAKASQNQQKPETKVQEAREPEQSVSSAAAPAVNQTPAASKQDVRTQDAKKEEDESADNGWSTPTIATAIFSGLLVAVGFLQAWVIHKQNRIMEQQSKLFDEQSRATKLAAEATETAAHAASDSATTNAALLATNREAERAYVGLSHKSPGLRCYRTDPERSPEEIPMGPDGLINVKVEVANHGRTPANVLQMNITTHIAADLPATPPYDDGFVKRGAFFLMPAGRFYISPPLIRLTVEQFEAVRVLSLSLWVIGYIDYSDVFGVTHRAGYARRYEPANVDGNNLVLELKPGYNYDETKKG